MKATCAPPEAPSETCVGCAAVSATNPVNLITGNTYIIQNDLHIPGLGGGLNLVRTWNSILSYNDVPYEPSMFGPNWRLNFDERIFIAGDHYVKYLRGDGSIWSFGYIAWDMWGVAAPANVVATLGPGPPYGWILTFQDGEKRVFDNDGKLISIEDRNGHGVNLTYDQLGRLTTVTDSASRHLYFAYGGAGYLVTSVTTDFGPSLSYSYDGQGRLSQVTEPDQSTLSFQYDSNSFISAVLDSEGKVLEAHTYDASGRGLTSSRANGVDAVTLSYSNQP